ncbi:MAG: CAP domain-containing protein [Clostridium sp.]|nr:CAP domain-containing protein [Clostridium sp.]
MSKSIRNFVILSIGVVITIGIGGTFPSFAADFLNNTNISSKILSIPEDFKYIYSNISTDNFLINTSNDSIENGNDTLIKDNNNSQVLNQNSNLEISKTSTSKSTTTIENNTDSVQYEYATAKVAASTSNDSYICDIETQILELINKERVAAGVPELSHNETMQYYARLKSKDMGDNQYFSHYDLNGGLVKDKILEDGITYKAWGENIAYISNLHDYNELAVRFVNNWMNSESHKENILSTNFTSVGIGVYKIGNTYYATQEFFK